MFKVLSIKGNSVRILTGAVTFDVLVKECAGKKSIEIPRQGFFINRENYQSLVRFVLDAYDANNEESNVNNAKETNVYNPL